MTWNTGGALASNFDDFFIDFKPFLDSNSDIYIICLQEIVQLNATQIVSSDPEQRVLWDSVFLEMLHDACGADSYVQLVANQLVGISITIFVKSDMVDEIKNVEISSIKVSRVIEVRSLFLTILDWIRRNDRK